MSERIEEIQKLEDKRGSKIICYLTGDRQQFPTNIGEDVIPILYRHLELIGDQDNIDLFIYTRGGDMVVPIRIVKLIRNYCKKFSVLVPYRCHSAGTLICLGADEIIMTKLGELTPVDPTSTAHPFNPKNPNPLNPIQQIPLPVSVEDVRSYLSFAKEELDAQDQQIVELYSKMTNQPYANNLHLHPLALGNVYRVQKMIKIITRRLLAMHFKKTESKDDIKINKIIQEITEDICVHNYPIYYDEAEALGLNVKKPDKKEEKLMWGLFELYSKAMKLDSQFNPIEEIGAEAAINGNYYAAFIESLKGEDAFNYTYQISKIQQMAQMGQIQMPNTNLPPAINLSISKMQWEKIR